MTGLNRENIDKVIEAIQDENKYFNMAHYSITNATINLDSYETFQEANIDLDHVSSDCGTASCICGWANHIRLIEDGGIPSRDELGHTIQAANWLGLTYNNVNKLFNALDANMSCKDISRDHAIAVLENLKKTDQVEWGMSQ